MFKMASSVKTTIKSLNSICSSYAPPETFMSDRGQHFDNNKVKAACKKWGMKLHVTPAYSPWVNGLVEGMNKLLLYVLAHLCAPGVGEDGWQSMPWEKLPKMWPDCFQKAIQT